MGAPFLSGSGAVWVQPDGPGTTKYYLGCHQIDRVSRPRGGAALLHAPSVARPGNYIPLAVYRTGNVSPVTFSIETDVEEAADWLEFINCPVPIYVMLVDCGRMDVFANYARAFILDNALITQDELNGVAIRSPGDNRLMSQSFSIAARSVHRINRPTIVNQNASGTTGRTASAICFCGPGRCHGSRGLARSGCQEGFIGMEGQAAAASNVYVTHNGGHLWMPTDTNPFLDVESVRGVSCVQIGRNQWRVIAARGTADPADPMEIAYSDDYGVTWTNADVGSVNGQYAIGRGDSMFAASHENIWLVTTGGYIYYSGDSGASWSAQESATITSQDYYAVHFCDSLHGIVGGERNIIVKTVSGGASWVAVSGPSDQAGIDILSLHMIDTDRWFISYVDGRVWSTPDAGGDWLECLYPDSGFGSVQSISFMNEYVGLIAHVDGAVGSIYRTIDGGDTWQLVDTSSVNAIYDVAMCDCNQYYVAGAF